MKKIFTTLLFSLFFACLSYGQIEFRHGLVIFGGKGSLRGSESLLSIYGNSIIKYDETSSIKYQSNFGIGYKFRINPITKPFFFDIDLNIGARKHKYNYSATYKNDTITETFHGSGDNSLIYGSLNTSFNYTLYKGLYAGIGLEPTLYFANMDGMFDKLIYDMPATAKIGYDFKFLDVAFTYKNGFFNVIKNEFKSCKMNDWQIQLFIPF